MADLHWHSTISRSLRPLRKYVIAAHCFAIVFFAPHILEYLGELMNVENLRSLAFPGIIGMVAIAYVALSFFVVQKEKLPVPEKEYLVAIGIPLLLGWCMVMSIENFVKCVIDSSRALERSLPSVVGLVLAIVVFKVARSVGEKINTKFQSPPPPKSDEAAITQG